MDDLQEQRRNATMQANFNREIEEKDNVISQLTNNIVQMAEVLQRLEMEPATFGVIFKINNIPDPNRFRTEDELVVVDQEDSYFGFKAYIISHDPVVDEEGCVTTKLSNGVERKYHIGSSDRLAQVRMVGKSDGTWAIVNSDGKPYEICAAPDLKLQAGNVVKINNNRQIISLGDPDTISGPIVTISSVTKEGIEIADKGEKRFLVNPNNLDIQEGDRVVVDSGFFSILRKLPKDPRNRYRLTTELNVDWNDIGGLHEAKAKCQEALEMPFLHKELFEFYGKKADRGILMYGPPGCGKTKMAKACATAMAKIHNTEVKDFGFIYVKSPEILDKWVGNSEAEIRGLFERGREHYRKYGYKAILAMDEFDAIAPERGRRRSSDIGDTLVPMFLGEMDGVDSKQTEENPFVILMTNRPEMIDPAIIRDMRISKRIKIGRPTPEVTLQILEIHTRNVPFSSEMASQTILALACSEIHDRGKLIYRVNDKKNFTFGDCISGAMLEGICENAKMKAFYRDLKDGTKSGLQLSDFQSAINETFQEQFGLNHKYDLEDFAEKHHMQPKEIKIERCFGAA